MSFKQLIKSLQHLRQGDSSHSEGLPEGIFENEGPLLIEGETGTGKTRLAKQVHEKSDRRHRAFIHLNCSEMSENLIESELFGHKKGSFSGAIQDKKGKLELADGGTLFLDELGSMPKNVQVKLLKAIEEKTFYPVGAEGMVTSDFRLISATCEPLANLVEQGEFREDLFFRIYGQHVVLSPLRERKKDIDRFIEMFLERSERKMVLTSTARKKMHEYHWPGNIRELERVVDQLLGAKRGRIEETDLPEHIRRNCHPLQLASKRGTSPAASSDAFSDYFELATKDGLKKAVEALENDLVKHFLERNQGKVRPTLGDLHISNSSFYRIFDRLSP